MDGVEQRDEGNGSSHSSCTSEHDHGGTLIAAPAEPEAALESWDLFAPTFVQAPDGIFWAAWVANTDADWEIVTSRGDGESWEPIEVAVADPGRWDETPHLAFDGDGVPWLAWSSSTGMDDTLHLAYWTGQGWSASQDVPGWDTVPNRQPVLAPAPDGSLWLAWVGFDGNDDEIYAARWDGITWSEPWRVSDDDTDPAAYDTQPRLAVGADGSVWVAWTGYEVFLDDEIYASRWDGHHWTHPQKVSTDDKEANGYPSLAVGDDGTAWLAWDGPVPEAGGEWRIHVSRWTAAEGWILEGTDEPLELVGRQLGEVDAGVAPGAALVLAGHGSGLRRAEIGEDVGDRLADGLRVDAVLDGCRPPAAPRRRLVSDIARCMESVTLSAYMITWPSTLRAARPIVWMSDVSERRNPSLSASRMATKRDLGQVEALTQQIDADQHVELAEPQVAQDLDALDGVDLAVQVPHLHPELEEVVGEVLGHLLGERGDQHTVALGDPGVDVLQEVVDLALGGLHDHLGIDEAGGPDDLLDDLGGVLELVGPGRGRQEDGLADALVNSSKRQRPVVGRRRQPEPVLDQRAPCGDRSPSYWPWSWGTVTWVSSSTHQEVVGEVVEQRVRRLARTPPVDGPRVVLDAVAEADLGHHLEVVLGAHPQPLGLEQLALLLELGQPLLELGLDALDRLAQALLAGDVVRRREDDQLVELGDLLAGERDRRRRSRSTSSPNSSMRTAVSS